MMHVCDEHIDTKVDDDDHQAMAVVGIAMIAMGEDIGLEMALRQLNHLVIYQICIHQSPNELFHT